MSEDESDESVDASASSEEMLSKILKKAVTMKYLLRFISIVHSQ